MISDYSIGELARISGVKATTIRFYESIGLMPKPFRSEGGQRRFAKAEADRLKFIAHARELGFGVPEIRSLLDLASDPVRACAGADAIAVARLTEVEDRIAKLQGLRTELKVMIEGCAADRPCRIIATLADHGLCVTHH